MLVKKFLLCINGISSFGAGHQIAAEDFDLMLKTEGIAVDRMIKNNYASTAQLKELMTAPPMTAEQHAKLMRKRIAHRRMLEDARESHLQNNADWEFSG